MFNFCAQSAEELLKFVEDLKESIAEVSEMEQIRIECKYLPLPGVGTFPIASPGLAGAVCAPTVQGRGFTCGLGTLKEVKPDWLVHKNIWLVC